jgi:cation transport ATPase
MDPIDRIVPILISALTSGFKYVVIDYIKPSAELTKLTAQSFERTRESIVLSGIVGIDVLIAQAFITTNSNETLVRLSLFSFALAIPLLAIGIFLNQTLWKAGYQANSHINYNVIKVIGVLSSFIGLIATFWHALWLIGVVFLSSGIIGILIALIYIGSLDEKLRAEGKKKGAKKVDITPEIVTITLSPADSTEQKETINKNEGHKSS